MPIGHISMGKHVTNAYLKSRPNKVLEIGIGYGYWGVTLRNYYGRRGEKGQLYFDNFRLDGVEVHEYYRNPFYAAYNEIYQGRIEDYLNILPNYDLVMLIDVVEHLTKELVTEICDKSKSMVLGVCTDMQEEQDRDPFTNKHENHITLWTKKDFEDLGFEISVINPFYFAATRIM